MLFRIRRFSTLMIAFGGLGLCVASSSAAPPEAVEGPGAATPPSRCEAGAGHATAERIQTRYDGIREIEAAFSQTSQSATFGGQALLESDQKTGRVVFAKPGKMRWTYEKPEPSVVVSNGETLWIYDVAGASVTRLSVTAGFLSGAALQFLLGDGKILESFEVSALDCQAERVVLALMPKADATYERLGLVANPKTGDILATSVTDLFGNVTEIEFADMAVNGGPKASLFEFEVPDGVELIEYEGLPAN